MEVNAKLKELEDEFKVLKAEIRNVLLDIREVILDRTNPLGEEHESAHLTLDLNTTARAMAAEAASHEAAKATESLTHGNGGSPHANLPDEDGAVSLLSSDEPVSHGSDDSLAEPRVQAAVTDAPEEPGQAEETVDETDDEAPAPRVVRRDNRSTEPAAFKSEEELPTEIPIMYQAYQETVPPLSGNVSISSWLTAALDAVGPQELERIITIHRLWGNLPANISRALAYLQEMLQQTEDNEPPWLKVMQELDRLAAL
jgi:hypothetical protein